MVLWLNNPDSTPCCGLDLIDRYLMVSKYCMYCMVSKCHVIHNLCSGSTKRQACPGYQGRLLGEVPEGSSLGEQTGFEEIWPWRTKDLAGGRHSP